MKGMAEHFDEVAASHERDFQARLGMAKFYDTVEEALSACAPCHDILVLGCGTGLEIERIHAPAHITAVDLSPGMLAELAKKEFTTGIRVERVCASLLELDLGVEAFDVVLSCYTLHHFDPEQKAALYGRIHRCLRPGGVFLLGDVHAHSADEQAAHLAEARRV